MRNFCMKFSLISFYSLENEVSRIFSTELFQHFIAFFLADGRMLSLAKFYGSIALNYIITKDHSDRSNIHHML